MKGERGQAFILVLILLAVGALLIVPTLRLTGDTLQSSEMYVEFTNEDYAVDATLEYGLWKLNWEPGYAASLPMGEESEPFCVTLNGVTAWTTVTPQATAGDENLSGQPLMKDKVEFKITKEVEPETANVSEETVFTYTVDFMCYDPDPLGTYLEEITDQLPAGLEYVDDSTNWDEEGWGIAPELVPLDEKWKKKEKVYELKWKLKDAVPPEGVTFEYGETKSMSFQVHGALDEGIYGNDIYTKDQRNMGAFMAPITVGDPDYNSVPHGYLDINKTVDKEIIYPNVSTNVTYTVTAENVDTVPVLIKSIEDWLPTTGYDDPVFVYIDNSTTANITSASQTITEVPLPDEYEGEADILDEKWKKEPDFRYSLKWKLENHEEARVDPIHLDPGETLTMSFRTNVTLEASGVYYDEFLVEVIRYPLEVVKTVPDPPPSPGWWPPHEHTPVHMTVTMENVDPTDNVTIKKLKARLPGPDTGEEVDAFQYVPDSTIITIADGEPVAYNDDDDFFKDNEVKSEWEGKKDRWKVEWDPETDIILEPGEVLTWEFDTTVNPGEPHITYSELLWEADLSDDKKRTLYSFPTAGIMVPVYDLEVETLSSILATNIWLGGGHKIIPKSKHWKKYK